MKVITAIEKIDKQYYPTVFLAGGITDCPWWQDEIIETLKPFDCGVLLNPRRRDFPINDPNASREQIEWEYYALNGCDIFSMWFSASESVQPICMYELGRHLTLRQNRPKTVVIGVEEGYKRENDVYIQTGLVNRNILYRISKKLGKHAQNIRQAALGFVTMPELTERDIV